jgi:mannitol/fructose-specific phosphotransferase system IIA component (Ntr-type)
MGLTKVASVAEEVRDPVRNLPLGMFLAFGTALVIYVVGTSIMVGVISAERLALDGGDLTPVATVAESLVGHWGAVLMTVGALLAFSSVANAGILSASRYPLAMGRDRLLPDVFSRLSRQTRTPFVAVYATVALVIAFVVVFNPMKIAKLASSFQLLMFAMSCTAVIVMRESRITSYDPGFRTPLYPWLQLAGIFAPLWLITRNGLLSVEFTGGLMLLGLVWYWYYARGRVDRRGAILHVFERLGTGADYRIEHELRGHIKEKGLRPEDPFDAVVARSFVIDLTTESTFDDVTERAARMLSERIPMTAESISRQFLKGTLMGITPVARGIALPHFTAPIPQPELVLVRSSDPISVHHAGAGPEGDTSDDDDVHALFFLVSPDGNPGQHLRILAQIATRIDEEGFFEEWERATTDRELKEVLLRTDYFHVLRVDADSPTARLVGRQVRDAGFPHGILVAVIRREGKTIVPTGETRIRDGDSLTLIGNPPDLERFKRKVDTA